MPIIRHAHSFDDHFTRIPNHWVRDNRLSLSAIGLITQLMSHSPGWVISQESLAQANNIGRDAMRTILRELMESGYLSRSEKRARNAAGHLTSYTYTTAEPTLAEPTLAEPTLAEPTHKKNILEEEQVKEENHQETVRSDFQEFWDNYPRKLDKGKAKRAFESALNRASNEEILNGVISYRADPNRMEEYTKYPATWLNADAWANGLLPYDPRIDKQRTQAEQDNLKKEWGNK